MMQARRMVAVAGAGLLAALASAPAVDAQVHLLGGGSRAETAALERTERAAERAARAGDWSRARRLYEASVREELARNRMPVATMWRLAGVLRREGDPLAAASLLDELAKLAGEFGLVAVEVSSLLEAGRMYRLAGMPGEASARFDLGAARLAAPGLSAAARRELAERFSP